MLWDANDFLSEDPEESRLIFWDGPNQHPRLQGINTIPWTPEQKDLIRNTLYSLYTQSPLAEVEVIDNGLAKITFINTETSNSQAASPGSVMDPVLAINMADAQNLQYLTFDGKVKSLGLERLLIHETIHAILDYKDVRKPDGTAYPPPSTGPNIVDYNHPDFDHLGETVRLTNQIMVETGKAIGDGQAGYDAAWLGTHPIIQAGVDYAPFGDIDLAYFDSPFLNQNPNDLNTSNRTDNSDDLLFGFDGEDQIRSGAGIDYLYGGVGDDALYGGSGLDLFHGGDRKTPISADGIDAANYLEGDMGNPTNHGITVSLDLNLGIELDGKKPVVVSDDGYGDSDFLYSIEKIVATSYDDTVTVIGETASC